MEKSEAQTDGMRQGRGKAGEAEERQGEGRGKTMTRQRYDKGKTGKAGDKTEDKTSAVSPRRPVRGSQGGATRTTHRETVTRATQGSCTECGQ